MGNTGRLAPTRSNPGFGHSSSGGARPWVAAQKASPVKLPFWVDATPGTRSIRGHG